MKPQDWLASWIGLCCLVATPLQHAAVVVSRVEGTNGVVRTVRPGLGCSEGGAGSYFHVFGDGTTPTRALGQLATFVRVTLDLHADKTDSVGTERTAFLLGTESHVTLSNERGRVQFLLSSGECAGSTVGFLGQTRARLPFPEGKWSWDQKKEHNKVLGSGAYRGVRGAGTFGFTAEIAPGADNWWSLSLDGELHALQPNLETNVLNAHWRNELDYAARVVTVEYLVRNRGNGDAFGVNLDNASSPDAGIRACGGPANALDRCPKGRLPQTRVGDLRECPAGVQRALCDSGTVVVRFQLPPDRACTLGLFGCAFETRLDMGLTDALDVPKSQGFDLRIPVPPPVPAGAPPR